MTLSVDISRDPTAPATARRAIDGLSGTVADDLLPDVKLLVSELVTNSVKYGGDGALRLQIDSEARASCAPRSSIKASASCPWPATGPRRTSAGGAFTSCRRSPTAGECTRDRPTCGSRSSADARRARH